MVYCGMQRLKGYRRKHTETVSKQMIRYTIEGVQHDKMVKTQVEPETVYKGNQELYRTGQTLGAWNRPACEGRYADSPITNTLF